jgi:hypothetical protein
VEIFFSEALKSIQNAGNGFAVSIRQYKYVGGDRDARENRPSLPGAWPIFRLVLPGIDRQRPRAVSVEALQPLPTGSGALFSLKIIEKRFNMVSLT